ncbi:MAG: PKD domain-containing protein [Desulfamplus sp.]|nr:PKD domain-containing protein [Desulfamplus sp.]
MKKRDMQKRDMKKGLDMTKGLDTIERLDNIERLEIEPLKDAPGTLNSGIISGFARRTMMLMVFLFGIATIVATSGDSGDSTKPVEEKINPAGVSIVVPTNKQVYLEGDFVSFVSRIVDPDKDEAYTYSWTSSRDGEIGTAANLNLNTLTAGSHVITLTLLDAAGNTVDSDSVTITVGDEDPQAKNTAPVAAITAPAANVSFNVGETITFQGTGTDAEDGDLTDSYLVWHSSLNGAIGTGGTVSTNVLASGEHTITLTVTDSKGSSTNAFIIITVGADASAPRVQITSPADSSAQGATYDASAGDTINFVGKATDFDGTPITGENLQWISSKDGLLFTGSTHELYTRSVQALNYEPLKEGEHTIYLRATGSAGTGQASIIVNLKNTSPVAEISNPPETCPENNTLCRVFAPGEWINFQGTAADTEDGSLFGESLEWTSHIDGFLGTGTSLNVKTDNVQALGNRPMSNGEHIITLEAKDRWGASGIDSVVINIGTNTPPVPSITYPAADYTSPTSTGFVTFYGEARDVEDGSLTSDDMEWYRSDRQGRITPEESPGAAIMTSSVRFDVSTFETGTHTITLVATDSMGSKGVTSRNITVP